MKLVLADWESPSVTEKVMVVEPDSPAAGVMTAERAAPLPPKTMLALGTRVVSEEEPVTTRFAVGVSASATVKLMAGVAALSRTERLTMGEMVGAVWAQAVKQRRERAVASERVFMVKRGEGTSMEGPQGVPGAGMSRGAKGVTRRWDQERRRRKKVPVRPIMRRRAREGSGIA